jgi:hypothetical protein
MTVSYILSEGYTWKKYDILNDKSFQDENDNGCDTINIVVLLLIVDSLTGDSKAFDNAIGATVVGHVRGLIGLHCTCTENCKNVEETTCIATE